jgi:succinate dehydrogenase / fumarate reductase cytochrome b subunit
MNSLLKVFTNTVGQKLVMAFTGAVLFAFVVVHMAGNLQIFLGREPLNHYADFLKSNLEILLPSRTVLLTCVILHITSGVLLTIQNRRRRDPGYEVKKLVGASLASRTMLVSGSVMLCFILYHLLHFTAGTINPELLALKDHEGRQDVYAMIVTEFANPWVVAAYVAGVGVVCFHLSHGVRALCESLGLRIETYVRLIDRISFVAPIVLFIGFIAVPLAVLTGVVK